MEVGEEEEEDKRKVEGRVQEGITSTSACAVRNHKPGLKYLDAGCVPDLSLIVV